MLLRSAAHPAKFKEAEILAREVEKYFGSPEALKHYRIDENFKGRKALEEARANAEDLGIGDLDDPAVYDYSEEEEDSDWLVGEIGGQKTPKHSRLGSPQHYGSRPMSGALPHRPKGYLEQSGGQESLSDFIGKRASKSGRHHGRKAGKPVYEYSS